uniref:Uncharacterized protein n=1 Tax=Avena sativa TaxID=4498 RepID=A0ACD5UKA2_AVESA
MTSLNEELEKKLQDSNATPMFLPLVFLKAITRDFSTELELGRGGYGVVYKGILRSGKIIAVKRLSEIHLLDDKTFQNEVSYLMEIKHQHVVQFIGYCAESSWETIKQTSGSFIWAEIPKRLLCFEYVCNKSLDKYISDESVGLEWNMRYEIIKGICSGLHFLHDGCRIVHLDLKPENILMDSTMMPKIADFGLARIFGEKQSRIVTAHPAGTRGYMAPEYLIRGVVSNKADIFSLGVIVIEIITGRRDYPDFHQDSLDIIATSLQQFTNKVLGSWRNKFESTSKYIPLDKYNQQVKLCTAIALQCVDPGMEKRPTAKDIVQVLSALDQMETCEELPSQVQCEDKSLVLDTTASKDLTPQTITKDMSSIGTHGKGKVGDANKCQEVMSSMSLSELITGNQHHLEVGKELSEPQEASELTSEVEAHEELSSGRQCTNKLLVLNTIACKDLSPHSLTEDILIQKTDDIALDEAKSVEDLSPTPFSESSIGIQNYQKGAKASSESHSARDTTTESEVIAGPNVLLDVYPLELRFQFEHNELIPCSLYLKNNTDKKVAFGLMDKSNDQTCPVNLPMYGIVGPRSTYTLVVTTNKHKNLPKDRKVDLVLQNSIIIGYMDTDGAAYTCKKHFEKAEELGNTVHKVTLKAVYALQGETTFESVRPLLKIVTVEDDEGVPYRNVSCIDTNQAESLILTGHLSGCVYMWNYDMQKSTGSIKASEAIVSCVRFIARKQWCLAGSHDGYVYVYNYERKMQKITSFKVHNDFGNGTGTLNSLAVHPTQPYVLSPCSTQIKLWDWDKSWFGWKCIQTFVGHSENVCEVAFNPKDANSFASASHDCTIKVWNLDSPKCKYTLSGHLNIVNSLDFFTRHGQQYLITGSSDETAKIWDMQKKECVRTLEPHMSAVLSVTFHPNLPVLITGTRDGAVHVWSSTNFRTGENKYYRA